MLVFMVRKSWSWPYDGLMGGTLLPDLSERTVREYQESTLAPRTDRPSHAPTPRSNGNDQDNRDR